MIADRHFNRLTIGYDFDSHERQSKILVRVRIQYEPALTSIEHDPVLMIHMSGEPSVKKQVHIVETTEGVIDASFFLPRGRAVMVDDAVHVQAFVRVEYDGIMHFMPAGHAMAYLSLLESGETQNLSMDLVSVKHSRDRGVSVHKGDVSISGSVSEPLRYEKGGDYAFVPANMGNNDVLAEAEAAKTGALVSAGFQMNYSLPPYAPELRTIRCVFYDTATGRLPGAFYFAMLDMPPASPAQLEKLLKMALRRHNMSEKVFMETVKSFRTAKKKLTFNQFTVLDVIAEGLTLLPNSIPYLSDLAAKNGGLWTRASLVIVELFDDALRRLTGDCEDFSKLIGWIFRSVCASGSATPLLGAWADMLGEYVPCASLLSVLGAKHGDGADIPGIPRIDDPRLFNRVGAHMACFLINRQYFLECTGLKELPDGIAGASGSYRSNPGSLAGYHTLTLEGTGQMSALIDTHSGYLGETGKELYHDHLGLNGRFYNPNHQGDGEEVPIPDFLMHWEDRSITEDYEVPYEAIPNNFYRIVTWFSVMGTGQMEVDGQTFRHTTPVVGGKYGAPIMHVARRMPMDIVLGAAYEPETHALAEHTKRHLAPSAPIDLPQDMKYAADTQQQFERIRSAVKRGMRGKERWGGQTRRMVRTRKMVWPLTDYELSGWERHIRENQYIVDVDLWLEHVHDGLANAVISVEIRS